MISPLSRELYNRLAALEDKEVTIRGGNGYVHGQLTGYLRISDAIAPDGSCTMWFVESGSNKLWFDERLVIDVYTYDEDGSFILITFREPKEIW